MGLRVPILISLMVVNAALEGSALALLLPLLEILLGSRGGQSSGMISTFIFDLLHSVGGEPTAMFVGLLLLAVLTCSAAVALTVSYLQVSLQAQYIAILQNQLFAKLLAAKWEFLKGLKDGDVISAITLEAQRAGAAFYQLCLILAVLVFVVIQLFVAVMLSPLVTASILSLGGVLFAVTYPFMRKATKHGDEYSTRNSELQASATELVTSMKLIKASAAEPVAYSRMSGAIGAVQRVFFRSNFELQLVKTIFEYASGVFITLALVLGVSRLGASFEELIVIMAIFVRLFPKVTALRQCVQSISLVLPALTNIQELTGQADTNREKPDGAAQLNGDVSAAKIEFRNLSVHSVDGRQLVRDVNLTVEPGEMIAFVGASGAGKTTLSDAILGLVSPSRGAVLIDGVPLQEMNLSHWRQAAGYMGQDALIFDGTIESNIRWRAPESGDICVSEAAQQAEVSKFSAKFDEGLLSAVGSRGSRLSGGERQRVALARALLGSPRLLILDEATSALDAETECRVMQAIQSLKMKVTVIVIAHRLSSVTGCDRIVMLDQGRIVEQGAVGALLAHPGPFRKLWELQNSSETV